MWQTKSSVQNPKQDFSNTSSKRNAKKKESTHSAVLEQLAADAENEKSKEGNLKDNEKSVKKVKEQEEK